MEKEAGSYEIGYILKSDLKEEEVLSFSEKLRNIITEKGGLIISEGRPKKQILAYSIKKETIATFNWIKFLIKPQLIKELKEYLDQQALVLRFITVKTPERKTTKPSLTKRKKIKFKKLLAPTLPTDEKKLGKKEIAPEEKEKKEEIQIKEEEIDKKIEELLGN